MYFRQKTQKETKYIPRNFSECILSHKFMRFDRQGNGENNNSNLKAP